MSNEKWKQNIETALSFGIPHISSYALTVEPKTALNKLIQTGKLLLLKMNAKAFCCFSRNARANDFIHYELSNFGKIIIFKNNSAYWLGKNTLDWSFGPQL
jgi:oxygen-independent coproporphyrinogen-3 oxidase